MDASGVQRLREEQEKAIQITNDQIDKWKKLKDDYKNLSDCLLTLPNKITHEVMVPFGSKAFMPGQLVHTNEILVLLGENWFVERSAKQASQIVKRRMKAVETQLEDLQLQKNLLVNRTSFTDEIQNLSEGSGEIKEINEKYDEEKEKVWKIQHKKNVKKYREELQREKLENPETDQKKQDDQSIWQRLDELEKLEEEQNELDDDDDDDVDVDSKPSEGNSCPSPSAVGTPSQDKKSVRWFDEASDHTESSESESEGNIQPEKGTGNRENLGVIHFTHSSVVPCLTENIETLKTVCQEELNKIPLNVCKSIVEMYRNRLFTKETPKEPDGHLTINSPTDIYKYFVKKSQTAPKSILKSPSFERTLPQEPSPIVVPVKKIEPENTFQREKAFAEDVVEKVPQMPTNQNIASVPENTKPAQPKKMSKFKASRLQR